MEPDADECSSKSLGASSEIPPGTRTAIDPIISSPVEKHLEKPKGPDPRSFRILFVPEPQGPSRRDNE